MVKSVRLSALLWVLLWSVAPLLPVRDCSSTSRPKHASTALKGTTSPRTTTTVKAKTTERKTTTPSTTTLSPEEMMWKIYTMHGGSGGHHSYYRPTYTSASSTSTKKQQSASSSGGQSTEDIMEKLYQQHALAIALSSSSSSSSSSASTSKPPEKSSSQAMDNIYQQHGSSSSSDQYKPASSSSSSDQYQSASSISSSSYAMDKIYQAHSASSPTMQHIMYQHSIQKTPSRTTTKPPRISTFSLVVEPLLKQLTPVGAGLGVIIAPLLLLDGFVTFFSNIGNYLNSFANRIRPGSRPVGQATSPLGFFRPFGNQPTAGSSFLRRQPRFDYFQMPKEEVQEFFEMLIRAIDRYQE